jgi:hypothetical protein
MPLLLYGVSPKRIILFEDMQKFVENNEEKLKTERMKSLSQTRWTTRGPAADCILRQHAPLQLTLSNLSTDKSVKPECRAKSQGLLTKINQKDTIFGLLAFSELAALLEKNSKVLQSSNLTAKLALSSLRQIETRLNTLRENKEFERIYSELEKFDGLSDEPPPKRKRAQSSKLADSQVEVTLGHGDTPGKDKLRRQFFEAIDTGLSSLESRFDQEDLKIMVDMENCIIDAHFVLL